LVAIKKIIVVPIVIGIRASRARVDIKMIVFQANKPIRINKIE
jgi:hypothetical protein